MEISGNSAFYAGLSTIQTGQNRVDQAAGQIANNTLERSAISQSSDIQAGRLRAVDSSQVSDVASNLIEMSQGKHQAELGMKVAKASDEMLGTLIDTYA
ncbi:pyrroloquinoline quinone biosynthesis protein PqqE [Pseudomonas sp. LB3P31]